MRRSRWIAVLLIVCLACVVELTLVVIALAVVLELVLEGLR